jgi:hypothetical protein
MQPHPFRYYGTNPGDWWDYGYVLVSFARPPDGDAKRVIGKVVDDAGLPNKARRWKGPVLSISLDEADRSTFDLLRRTLLEVHEAWPIEQAVNHLARSGSDDDWENWSLEQGEPSEDLYDPNDLSVWSFE